MKKTRRKVSFTIIMFLGILFSVVSIMNNPVSIVYAQTSTDTNPCFSINQSFYTGNGYRAPYSQIYLSDGTTLAIKNQSTPSILEDFVYTMGGAITPTCNASNVVPHVSVLPNPTSGTDVPWSNTSSMSISTGLYSNGSGYMTYHFLPSTSQASYQTQYTNVVKPNEDALINEIAQKGGLTFVGQNGTSQVSSFLPMTNCVKISGNGPRKIVFMRGKSLDSLNLNVSNFLANTNDIINNGFKTIDPFKTYINQFSFYVDLKKYDDTTLPSTFPAEYQSPFSNAIKSASSCNGVDSIINNADEYILSGNFNFTGLPTDTFGFTFWKQGIVYLQSQSMASKSNVAIHETGHALALLRDEYFKDVSDEPNGSIIGHNTNCSFDPEHDYRNSLDNRIYGALPSSITQGCTYNNVYRPSNRSIMYYNDISVNPSPDSSKFNVISCGYIITAIKGELIDKSHAETHWSECMNLDTIKQGISPLGTAPITNSVTPVIGSSNTNTVSGSGFTPTGNSVKLTPGGPSARGPSSLFFAISNFVEHLFSPQTAYATTSSYYEINDIPSTDGRSMTFTVPSNVPDGTYTMSVGALNSPWADTSYTVTVSGHGAGDPTTAIPVVTPGSGIIPASASYSCSTGYVLTADNAGCFKPVTTSQIGSTTIAATVSYNCNYFPSGTIDNSQFNQTCFNAYGTHPANISHSCPAGAGSPVFTTSWVCNVPPTSTFTPATVLAPSVSYSCPTTYTLSGANCIPLAPPVTITCPSGNILTGTTCYPPPTTPSIPPLGTSSVAPTYGCPTGYTKQTNNTCVWPAISSYEYNFNSSNPLGGKYADPSFNFGGVDVTAYADDTTATKWCQFLGLKSTGTFFKYSKGVSGPISIDPLNTGRNEFDGTKWTMYPPNGHPAYFTCSGTTGPVAGVAAAVTIQILANCPTGFTLKNSMCYSSTIATAPVVTVGTVTSSTIPLSWTLPYNPGVSSYTISLIGGGTIATPTTTSYTVSNLTPATKYCYTVSAIKNPNYIGNTSTQVCATTKIAPPSANFSTPFITSTSTTLNWSANLIGTTTFILTETSPVVKSLYTGTAKTFQWSGLTPSTAYCTQVVAKTASQQATSSSVCFTTSAIPPILSIVGIAPNMLSLEWTAPDPTATGYSIVETVPNQTTLFTNLVVPRYNVFNLNQKTNYCMVIVSVNALNQIATSSEACATTTQGGGGGGSYPSVPPPVSHSDDQNTDPGTGGEVPTGGRNEALPFNYQSSSMANVWGAINWFSLNWFVNLFR